MSTLAGPIIERRPPPTARTALQVLVVGGGVAGLETILALRALGGDRLAITIVAPELKFVNRSMAADQPFQLQRVRGLRLQDMAADLGAHWHRGVIDRVEPERRRVVTRDRVELPYDRLVLAPGAHPESQPAPENVLTYRGGHDGPAFRLLLQQLITGRVSKVAFVKPPGPTWPLPLYDLALMSALRCIAGERTGVELSLITPEEEPLGMFGHTASAGVRRLLEDSAVTLYAGSYGVMDRAGWLTISPGARNLQVDRVVTEPRLVGPNLRGIPCGRDGFIQTDAHGRLTGLDGVFAAGDATAFPIKQGGLAAQQADVVAEVIAASAGADVDPQPFRPVLRGVLLTGGAPRYLHADISGEAGDDSTISARALWWPPDKLAGRYLAPYLSSQVGDALDVVADQELDAPGPTSAHSGLRTLLDLPSTDGETE